MPRHDERHGNTRLYVGRLPSRTRSRDLEHLFSKYGRVRDVDMKHDFAFIDFSDSRDADDARYRLNGREFDGSRLLVEFAKGVPRGPGGLRDYGGRGPPPGSGRCFNCGLDGHWARDCKDGDWKNKCYRCGERGHIERNCRYDSKSSRNRHSYSRSPSPRHGRSRSRSCSRGRSYSRSRTPPRRGRHGSARDKSRSPNYSRSPPKSKSPPHSKNRKQSRSPDNDNSRSPAPRSPKSTNSPSPIKERKLGHSPMDKSRSPSPAKERKQSLFPIENSRSPSPNIVEKADQNGSGCGTSPMTPGETNGRSASPREYNSPNNDSSRD